MTEIILWKAFQKSREQSKSLVQGSWKNVSDLLLSLRQLLSECLLCKVTHTCRYQVRHVNKPGPYIWTSAFCHNVIGLNPVSPDYNTGFWWSTNQL